MPRGAPKPRSYDPIPSVVKRRVGKMVASKATPPPQKPLTLPSRDIRDASTSWTITIPGWQPTALNQLVGNYRKAARLKKRDASIIHKACLASRVPIATLKRMVTLTIILGYRQRGCDPDAYWKSLLDGLVKCGALVDDSRAWVELSGPKYLKSETKFKSTVIQLEDVV